MGDGTKKNGKEIFHTYEFPGEYIISLTAKIDYFTGNHKRKVKVIAPKIVFSKIDFDKNIIGIKNDSNEILDLSGWVIKVDGDEFIIPQETFIGKKAEIKFSNKILGFKDFTSESKIYLLFPNKQVYLKYLSGNEDSVVLRRDKQNDKKKVSEGSLNNLKKEEGGSFLKIKVRNVSPNVMFNVVGAEAVVNEKNVKNAKNIIINKKLEVVKKDGNGVEGKVNFKNKGQGASIFGAFDINQETDNKKGSVRVDEFLEDNYFFLIFLVLMFVLIMAMIVLGS